jgi:hypothetical protein
MMDALIPPLLALARVIALDGRATECGNGRQSSGNQGSTGGLPNRSHTAILPR